MNPPDRLRPPEPLAKTHDRAAFDCGAPELNDYLKNYALQNQKKSAARTYAALRGDRVVGYYTLAFGGCSPEDAPAGVAKGIGKYPVPVLILARLAVDVSEQGRGMGAALLKDALLRALQAAEIAGLRAVLVHAKDDAAKRFYQRHGFECSPGNSRHLFLTIPTLAANLGGAR